MKVKKEFNPGVFRKQKKNLLQTLNRLFHELSPYLIAQSAVSKARKLFSQKDVVLYMLMSLLQAMCNQLIKINVNK
jgi:hypothetical protein